MLNIAPVLLVMFLAWALMPGSIAGLVLTLLIIGGYTIGRPVTGIRPVDTHRTHLCHCLGSSGYLATSNYSSTLNRKSIMIFV